MLNMVLKGRRVPGLDTALGIESASNGKVPANAWVKRPARKAA